MHMCVYICLNQFFFLVEVCTVNVACKQVMLWGFISHSWFRKKQLPWEVENVGKVAITYLNTVTEDTWVYFVLSRTLTLIMVSVSSFPLTPFCFKQHLIPKIFFYLSCLQFSLSFPYLAFSNIVLLENILLILWLC